MTEINVLAEIMTKLDILTEQNVLLQATVAEKDKLIDIQRETFEDIVAEMHDEILQLRREHAREKGFNPALAYKCYQHGIQRNFSSFSDKNAQFEEKGSVIPKLARQKLAHISEQLQNMKLCQ